MMASFALGLENMGYHHTRNDGGDRCEGGRSDNALSIRTTDVVKEDVKTSG